MIALRLFNIFNGIYNNNKNFNCIRKITTWQLVECGLLFVAVRIKIAAIREQKQVEYEFQTQ